MTIIPAQFQNSSRAIFSALRCCVFCLRPRMRSASGMLSGIASALPLPPTPRRLPRLRPTSLRRLAPNVKPRRPPLLPPAPTRQTLLRANKRMLRQPLLLARERTLPLSKIGGRLPRRPKRHARTMQRRQRSANAPRHPPSRSRRHQLRADLLLRLARNPGFRLQLNENSPPTIDDHRVGKPAPHAPPLLQQPIQTRRGLFSRLVQNTV